MLLLHKVAQNLTCHRCALTVFPVYKQCCGRFSPLIIYLPSIASLVLLPDTRNNHKCVVLDKQLDASAKHLYLHMAWLLQMANMYLGVMERTYSRNEQGALIKPWASCLPMMMSRKKCNLDRRLL